MINRHGVIFQKTRIVNTAVKTLKITPSISFPYTQNETKFHCSCPTKCIQDNPYSFVDFNLSGFTKENIKIPSQMIVSISSPVKKPLETEQNLDSYNISTYWNLCRYGNVHLNETAYRKTSNRGDVSPITCQVVMMQSFSPKLYVWAHIITRLLGCIGLLRYCKQYTPALLYI
jgi:hypothetical protein